jgi:hypothetical protein
MASTIFKATYSGVPVYEMPTKGVAVSAISLGNPIESATEEDAS